MTAQNNYTIGELAEAAEVTPRTIRYYVAEELLPPPAGSGRAATYDQEHLERLALIKILKDEYLPLQEIRTLLSGLDRRAMVELVEQKRVSEVPPAPTANSAKEYLQMLLKLSAPSAEAAGTLVRHQLKEARLPAPGHFDPVKASEYLPQQVAPAPVIGRAEAGPVPSRWQRLELVPGIELHVKEEISADPAVWSKIDRLIGAARQMLG